MDSASFAHQAPHARLASPSSPAAVVCDAGSVWAAAAALCSSSTPDYDRRRASVYLEDWDGPSSTPATGSDDTKWEIYRKYLIMPAAALRNRTHDAEAEGPTLLLAQMMYKRLCRPRHSQWFLPLAEEIQREALVGAWKWTTPEGQDGSPHSAAVATALARCASAAAVRRDCLQESPTGISAIYGLVESSVQFQETMACAADVPVLHRNLPWILISCAADEVETHSSPASRVRSGAVRSRRGSLAVILANGLREALGGLRYLHDEETSHALVGTAFAAYARWSEVAREMRHDDADAVPGVRHLFELPVAQPPDNRGEGQAYTPSVLSFFVAQLGHLSSSVPTRAVVAIASSLSTVTGSVPALRYLLSSFATVAFLTSSYERTIGSAADDDTEAAAALLRVACRILMSPIGPDIVAGRVEDVVSGRVEGWEQLVAFVSRGQADARHAVCIVPLAEGTWLELQDYPVCERHESLGADFFLGLCSALLDMALINNENFRSWEHNTEMDEDEWKERRDLSKEVLVSSYYLLNGRLVEMLVEMVSAGPWNKSEVGLWGLRVISPEVCRFIAEKKKNVSQEANDNREHMLGILRHLAWFMCKDSGNITSMHPRVLSGALRFVAGFAPALSGRMNGKAAKEDMNDAHFVRLLSFLHDVIAKQPPPRPGSTEVHDPEADEANVLLQSASAVRGLLSSWRGSAGGLTTYSVAKTLPQLLVTTLTKGDSTSAMAVAEGCARALATLPRETRAEAAPATFHPVLMGLGAGAQLSPAGRWTHIDALRTMVKFSDQIAKVEKVGLTHPLGLVLQSAWALCAEMMGRLNIREDMDDGELRTLESIFGLYEQVMFALRESMSEERVANLISTTVRVYDAGRCTCALRMLGTAVETYGTDEAMVQSFAHLLAHLTSSTDRYLRARNIADRPELVTAFFELARKYILFCPSALLTCPEFVALFDLSMLCLTGCDGERESTRAVLVFLSNLVGWRKIRFSETIVEFFKSASAAISSCTQRHGVDLAHTCLFALAGGSTQMLWPIYAECLHSLLTAILDDLSIPDRFDASRKMIAVVLSNPKLAGCLPVDVGEIVVRTMFELLQRGPKSKQKFKMLLMDFAKLCHGEIKAEDLLVYQMG